MGLEISKRYSYSFHSMAAKRHEDIGYHGEYRLLLFLAIGQLLNFCGTLKFCTRVNGKS